MKKKATISDMSLKNIISVLLAILGILLILFPLQSYLFNKLNSEDLQNAEKLLTIIETRINAVQENSSANISSIQGFKSQEGTWILTGWSKNDPERPDKCFLESCLMICLKKTGNLKEDCQKAGVIKKIEKEEVKVINKREIHEQRGSTLTINTEKISEEKYFEIPELLFQLKITKNSSSLIIETEGEPIILPTPVFQDNIK